MCHVILFLPVLALPIFWLVPLEVAVPVYLLITLFAIALYWLVARSMGRRPGAGRESLIGEEAKVVSTLSPGDHAQYLVRAQGELWSADSPDVLKIGELVNVTAVDGIRLLVRRNGNSFPLEGRSSKKEVVGDEIQG